MDASREAASTKPGAVTVRETGRARYKNDVLVGRHWLVADEPLEAGGGDAGPGPYDYLCAALGACTSITLRMYADRKGWPLERVTVQVRHRKGHAEDCEACEQGESARVDILLRDIQIAGALDAEQRSRLREIADKCPVHRTLHGPVVVRTRLIGENDAASAP